MFSEEESVSLTGEQRREKTEGVWKEQWLEAVKREVGL